MGLATVLGLAPRGFFIPYRHAAATRPDAGYPELEPLFRQAEAAMAAVIGEIDARADDLLAIGEGRPPQPRWRQDWFPRLDAAAAYVLVRTAAPARIVEIGAGHSTRFVARAIRDGGLSTRQVAIDPAPRAALGDLPVDLVRATVQDAGPEVFRGLAAGDMVMVDSSHILMPGSDVDILLNRVLPTLPAGILVHFHDIVLPDAYPADWRWRAYNEQSGVAALLTGGGWAVRFSSHYAATRMADAVRRSVVGRLPLGRGAKETGLWLTKTAAPVG